MKQEIRLEQIEDNTERAILQLLEHNDKYTTGDILMRLKLSYRKDKEHLRTLRAKNWISNTERAPYYTLKISLK